MSLARASTDRAGGMAARIGRLVGRVPVATVYAVGLMLIAWPFARALTGALGPDPVRTLEQDLGLSALQVLVAMLDVADAGRIWNDIVRRPWITVGMAAFLMMLPR